MVKRFILSATLAVVAAVAAGQTTRPARPAATLDRPIWLAFAGVTISGQRFVDVEETLVPGTNQFGVKLTVLAAASENPLEYRVYAAGQPPAQAIWTPAAPSALLLAEPPK